MSVRPPLRPPLGYTLVELMVVMVVLGVLATAVIPLAEINVQRDRERELKHSLWEIRDAIDAYKRASDSGTVEAVPNGSGYPPSLEALVAGVPNPKDSGRLRYFLRRIPRDPFADEGVPPGKSWGLRSYDSAPDRPRPGSDVYDVFSRSEKTGLNGMALRDW